MFNLFSKKEKDDIYWLKVSLKQAQHDIKVLKEDVEKLKGDDQKVSIKSKYAAHNLDTVEVKIGG